MPLYAMFETAAAFCPGKDKPVIRCGVVKDARRKANER